MPSKCLHTHKIHCIQNLQANEAPRYKTGATTTKWAHQPIYKNTNIHRVTFKVPLEHQLLPLPQVVVPHPLLVPLAL
jgi:hypothetical protein